MDPGNYPRLPTAATAHQKEEAFACYKCELLKYREFGAIVVCCHNQPQKSIHEDYLAKLEDPQLGLAKKFPKDIFDHGIARYAQNTIPMQNDNCR